MKKNKVLVIFSSSNIGGTERSISRMALFDNSIVEFKLSSFGVSGPWSEWVMGKKHNPMLFGERDDFLKGTLLGSFISLYAFLKKNNFNAIYIFGAKVSFFLKLMKFFLPKIVLIHGVRWNPNQNNLLDIIFTKIENYSKFLIDGWIVNAKATKKTIIRRSFIKANKIYVIYNGIEFNQIPKKSINKKKVKVLSVANIALRKGYLEYLNVVSEVIKKVPNVQFDIVGRDDMNGRLHDEAKKRKLDNFINFIGYTDNVQHWYNKADIFAFPSLWGEGCPTSIMEAMSHKLPVIAYRIDGISEILTSKSEGFIIGLGNERGFARKLIELASNHKIRKKMGLNGFRKAKKEFILNNCYKDHCRSINKIIKERELN